jgi:fatty acid desaturase
MQNKALATNEGVRTSRLLREELQAISQRARERHGWLAHQDAIGFGIFALSSCAIVLSGWTYVRGSWPAWVAVPVAAFFMSLLHELEHDLIHRLYFRNQRFIYDFMMATVWLLRPSTINPWTRRDLHMHHHRVSGTESDLEERAITNGERWGLRRLIMTLDSMFAIYLRPFTMRKMVKAYVNAQRPGSNAERKALYRQNNLSYFPLGFVHYTLWHAFLVYHGVAWVTPLTGATFVPPASLQDAFAVIDVLVMVWLLPNVLRSFCLHFVSSNIHYYGDIDPRDVTQQTQVWTTWWTFPVQLFCFNFGGTHAIHHFAVQDPFYLRLLIAKEAYPAMRAHGVRFNDFDTFFRANRWQAESHGSGAGPETRPHLTRVAAGKPAPMS